MKPNLLAVAGAILLPLFLPAQTLLDPLTQPQFVTPLPIPKVIDARKGGTLKLRIRQFEQHLGLKDPATGKPMRTTVWGYDGAYPGPTILVQKDVPINVFYDNELIRGGQPLPHLLPIDPTVHWALDNYTNWQQYGIPVVTHLHGGHTESASDGLPEAWYTPRFKLKGPDFVKGDRLPYTYSNDQEAATLWYHDHALGITRLNVYAGLAGFYLLTDANEAALQAANKLPAAPYDLGLAIQDRMFTVNGQLFYPSDPPQPGAPTPSVLPEFFGDFILVNGAAWPVLEVEPRPYRLRLLNGSDSRFYNLYTSNGTGFTQIGTDNGLLHAPVALNQLLMGPGERRDVIVDFSNLQGQTIILHNNARTPYPDGDEVDPATTGKIMAFAVTKRLDKKFPASTLPAVLRPPIIPLQTNLPTRKLILFEATDEYGRLMPKLGTFEDGVKSYHEPVTENPALHATEVWEIYNNTMDAHPIHLHLVRMQLLGRQPFTADVDETTGKPTNISFVGALLPPGPDEAGWKDTYVMLPGQVTRVVANFDREGEYAWHCHILSHEDHEMMRPLYVGLLPGHTMRTGANEATLEIEEKTKLQVQPNPFSNDLRISLYLPQASTLAVNIYDAKASLVRSIYSGRRDAGLQQFALNGTGWASGTYFLEVLINGKRIMRKLVLQK